MIDLLPWFLVGFKIILLGLSLFYLVFSYVVLTKVRLLAGVLETEVSPLLVVLVGSNILVSLILFLVGLLVL